MKRKTYCLSVLLVLGKTHIATAIGIEAAKNRVSTYFISCHDLISQLSLAHSENRLVDKIKQYNRYKLLIIDEVRLSSC